MWFRLLDILEFQLHRRHGRSLGGALYAWCWHFAQFHSIFRLNFGFVLELFVLFVSVSMEIVFGQKINHNDLVGHSCCVHTIPNINIEVRCLHYVKFHQFLIKFHFRLLFRVFSFSLALPSLSLSRSLFRFFSFAWCFAFRCVCTSF